MSTAQLTWDKRFMLLARNISGWSKDPDQGVGALVVSPDRRQFSPGYNGLPRGHSDDPAILGDKELKNRLTIHAEMNAVLNAPFDLTGATLYVTKPPCTECMKGLIQRGISRVVYQDWRVDSRWYTDQVFAVGLGRAHGIEFAVLEDCVDYPTAGGGDI